MQVLGTGAFSKTRCKVCVSSYLGPGNCQQAETVSSAEQYILLHHVNGKKLQLGLRQEGGLVVLPYGGLLLITQFQRDTKWGSSNEWGNCQSIMPPHCSQSKLWQKVGPHARSSSRMALHPRASSAVAWVKLSCFKKRVQHPSYFDHPPPTNSHGMYRTFPIV